MPLVRLELQQIELPDPAELMGRAAETRPC